MSEVIKREFKLKKNERLMVLRENYRKSFEKGMKKYDLLLEELAEM